MRAAFVTAILVVLLGSNVSFAMDVDIDADSVGRDLSFEQPSDLSQAGDCFILSVAGEHPDVGTLEDVVVDEATDSASLGVDESTDCASLDVDETTDSWPADYARDTDALLSDPENPLGIYISSMLQRMEREDYMRAKTSDGTWALT
jgi:hypothetical protein